MTSDRDAHPAPTAKASATDRIEERARFDFVRYANCWEDADVLVEALEPRPGSRVLSIASAGDNVLALLAEGAEVVAADLSPAQLACLDLRRAAFRQLDHEGVLSFLGVRDANERLAVFDELEADLSSEARTFWRAHRDAIETGVVHMGKFEAYFRTFRRWILPLVHSKRTIARALEPKDADGRREFWDRTWNTRRWRMLFRVFFSRFVMGRMGRDPEFFRYVEGSVSDRILKRAEYAMTALRTHDNPFLEYIATGRFERSLPRYLRPEHFEAVRDGLERLTLFEGTIEEAARAHAANPHGPDGFDGFNLSDVFEYVDEDTAAAMYASLVDHARPRARVAYWNTLVPRRLPPELVDRVEPLEERSAQLFAEDRAFFYCHFQVDRVRPL